VWKSPGHLDQALDQRRAERAVAGIIELAGEAPTQQRPLSHYGLDAPDIEVTIVGASDQTCGAAVATRAPGGAGYYVAARNSDVVMLLPEHLYSRLDVRLEDLAEASQSNN
jgi:hypothetical protein